MGAGSGWLGRSVGLTQTEGGRGATPALWVRNSGETQPLMLRLHHKQFKPGSRCHRQDPRSTALLSLGSKFWLGPPPRYPAFRRSCWVPETYVQLALLPLLPLPRLYLQHL